MPRGIKLAVIPALSPTISIVLHVSERRDSVFVQTLITELSTEALNAGELHCLADLDQQPN